MSGRLGVEAATNASAGMGNGGCRCAGRGLIQRIESTRRKKAIYYSINGVNMDDIFIVPYIGSNGAHVAVVFFSLDDVPAGEEYLTLGEWRKLKESERVPTG